MRFKIVIWESCLLLSDKWQTKGKLEGGLPEEDEKKGWRWEGKQPWELQENLVSQLQKGVAGLR